MTCTRALLAGIALTACIAASPAAMAASGLQIMAQKSSADQDLLNNGVQMDKRSGGSPLHEKVAEIYNAALALNQQGKFEEGWAKIGEEDAIEGKSDAEQEAIDRLKFVLALHAEKTQPALELLDKLPAIPDATKATYLLELVRQYQEKTDWPAAIANAKRYLALGGPEVEKAQGVIWRGYYTLHDFPNALSASLEALATKEKNGTKPDETLLKAIRTEAKQVGDADHVTFALAKLASFYPSPATWTDLINDGIGRPGFPKDALALDIFRLMRATDSLSKSTQYHDYVVLALQIGIPEEAKAVLDLGTAKGALTAGDVPDLPRLRDKVLADSDADQKSLSNSERDNAKEADGEPLVRAGLCYAALGQYDKAIPLIEHGIAKGTPNQDLSRLRLGTVYLAAGLKDKAAESFGAVRQPGSAELTKLWLVKLNQAA
jgi:tetratricopeptide (TPR) repeat protein